MTAAKAYKGMGMNGPVAKWYATNAEKRMDDYRSWARQAARLSPGNQVLEVAPGPGYFSIELATSAAPAMPGGWHITGLDISETFVQIARKNAAQANVAIDFRQGNASLMPFTDDRFDFVFCSAAFKNFADPVGALREMHRVLKPGGKALIIDLRKDASRESIDAAVSNSGLNWLNTMVTKIIFGVLLLKRAYKKSDIERFVSQTGFRSVEIAGQSLSLEILLTK